MIKLSTKQRKLLCIALAVVLSICIGLMLALTFNQTPSASAEVGDNQVVATIEQPPVVPLSLNTPVATSSFTVAYDSNDFESDFDKVSDYYWSVNAYNWDDEETRVLQFYEEDMPNANKLTFTSYWYDNDWDDGDSGSLTFCDSDIYMVYRLECAPKIDYGTWSPSVRNNYAAGYQGVTIFGDNYVPVTFGKYEGFVYASDLDTEPIDLTRWDSLITDDIQKIYAFSVYEQDGYTYISQEFEIGSVSRGQPLPVTPTKVGHTFTGWYTDKACTNLYTKPTITEDITLYAGWRANQYSIKFNGNGSTSGSMQNQTLTYNKSESLTVNGFLRTGYRFDGWSLTAGGAVRYTDAQTVLNLTSVDGAVLALHAQWTLVEYKVAFNANGGSGTLDNVTFTKDIAGKLPANTFTKTGYTFVGWSRSAAGEVEFTDAQSVTNVGAEGTTTTLYAVWKVNTYSIKFDSRNGSGIMDNQTVAFDTTVNLNANAFTRTGYRFLGWSTTSYGDVEYEDGAEIRNPTADADGQITLYAVWERIKCKVTFVVDDEVYMEVTVDYGTPTAEVVGSAVDSATHEVEDEEQLPNG